MNLERYLVKRRYWEVILWMAYLSLALFANTVVALFDLERTNSSFQTWEPIVWEATSNGVQGLLIFLILRFDRRFPISLSTWRKSLLAHTLFVPVFSLFHVTGMYWLRVGIYKVIGNNSGYQWANWWTEFSYEYLKDFRTYFLYLTMIYLYRFILRRLQGEAEFLSEGREEVEPIAVTDRFLIKKLGREFLVRVDDIDWIESAGNYVNLHVGTRVYPLRETMANMADRLAAQGFQRVHRSSIVNLDRITEIVPFDTGDGEALLASGVRVPVSRRYRKKLKEWLR